MAIFQRILRVVGGGKSPQLQRPAPSIELADDPQHREVNQKDSAAVVTNGKWRPDSNGQAEDAARHQAQHQIAEVVATESIGNEHAEGRSESTDAAAPTSLDRADLSPTAISLIAIKDRYNNEEEACKKAGGLLRSAGSAAELDSLLGIARDLFPAYPWPVAEAAGWASRHGDWARAITFSKELVKRFPEHAAGHVILAHGLRETGEIEAADNVLQDASSVFPDLVWPLAEQAWAAQANKNWLKAAECSGLIRDRFPLERAGYMVSIHALRQLKHFAEAEDILGYSLAQPQFAAEEWPWVEGAWLAQQRGDWHAGIRRAADLRDRFPKHPAGYQIGAFCFRQLKQFAEAEALLQIALNELAEPVWAFADYARLAQFQGNWADAEIRWTTFRTRFRSHLDGYIEGAIVSRHIGKLESAEDVLGDATQRFPNEAAVFEQYARVAQDRSDWPEAERRWNAARQRFPENHKIALAYALLPASGFFHQKNNWDEAFRRLVEFHQAFPHVAEGYVAYINALCRAKSFAAAEEIATEGSRRFPRDIAIALCRGEIAEAAGKRAEAIARYSELIAAFPNSHVARTRLSAALCRAEKFDDAERICQKAMALFSSHPEVFREFAEVAMRRHDWRTAYHRWIDAEGRFPSDQHVRKRLFDVRLALVEAEEETPSKELDGVKAATVASLEAETPADLVARFESLGGSGQGCEFGIVQRLAGSEPLGLLRWSAMNHGSLVAALKTRFEGVGDPDQTVLGFDKHSESDPEYITSDKRFGMRMHTFVKKSQIPFEKMHAQSCRRIRFLKSKMIEELQSASKIFVFKLRERTLTNDELSELYGVLRSYGDNTLLYVRHETVSHASGTVEALENGLIIGYIDHFSISDSGEPRTPNLSAWISICRGAAKLNIESSNLRYERVALC